MTSREQFFSLQPDKTVCAFLKNCKQTALSLAGEQKYINDEPHLTLYLNKFHNINNLIKELNNSFSFPKLEITLNGWKTFYNDPLTGGHTLVISFDNESLEILRDIQKRLINIVCKYRIENILDRYKVSTNFTKSMKESIMLYGFPFVGKIWEGHFTVASFDIPNFAVVWEKLQQLSPPTKTEISVMNFYNICKDNFELINSWYSDK